MGKERVRNTSCKNRVHPRSCGTSTCREFSKRRNDGNRPWATRLLLLLTNPRSPRICAEDGGRSRVFRRQRISLGQNKQFGEEAIGEGTFGQIRREIRSRTR
jgi:hypothetical protein